MKTRFPVILALWGAGLGAAGQYAKVSVVFDQLVEVYPVGPAALGLVVSIVGLVGILFGVAAGVLVARAGLTRAFLAALWVGAALSVLQSALPPYPAMLALRVLEGASHLALVVAAPTLIAQLSEDRHRGLTLSLWSTFFGVTYTLLVWFGLPMVAALGLPSLFLFHAAWMAVFALLLAPMLRGVGQPVPAEGPQEHLLQQHLAIYRSPYISAPAVGWLFYTFCFLAILTLIPPYLPEATRAQILGAMPLVSILVSMTFGIALIRRIGALGTIYLGLAGCVVCTLWLWSAPGGAAPALALAAMLGLVQGASFAVVPELNRPLAHRAQANGALAQMGNIGNTLGTPVLALAIAGGGYGALMGTATVVFAAGLGAHLWLAARRRRTAP